MTFNIAEGNIKNIKEPMKYVEVQIINSASIVNFKNLVGNLDLFLQFYLDANPNDNYIIIFSILEQAKNKNIPLKNQSIIYLKNLRKHCIKRWMNRELLTLINKKMISIEIRSQQLIMLNMKLTKYLQNVWENYKGKY